MLTRLRAALGSALANLDWVRRDPLRVIESEVRSPTLQRLCLGLVIGRLAVGDLLGVRAWMDLIEWRLRRVRLQPSDEAGLWRPTTARGAILPAMPRRFVLLSKGEAVVCALSAEGRFLGGGIVHGERPAALRPPRRAQTIRAYSLAAGAAQLSGRPVLGLQVFADEMRAGASASEALRRALPPRARHVDLQGRPYRAWLSRQERGWKAPIVSRRLVSVLMPVHDPEPANLRAAIASVFAQRHPAWELCLADDGSSNVAVLAILAETASDTRVRLTTLPESVGVSTATNAALALARGELVAFLDHDDLLAPDALAVVAAAFDDPEVVAVYSDEDTIDMTGRPRAPTFKTRFDGERLLSQNFANHLFCARANAVRAVGTLQPHLDGAQDHDLVLRLMEAAPNGVRHVPGLLYHWRRFPGGASFSQREPQKAAASRRLAVEEHLRRGGVSAEVGAGEGGFNRITWPLPALPPRVRVIVPTRDRGDLLEACLSALRALTDYAPVEVVVVDNGSTDPSMLQRLEVLATTPFTRVLRVEGGFNHSRLNNLAAADPGVEVLCLLNDDILIVEPDWLREMVSLAIRPSVGAVGAKLFYPDGRLQHAGVVLGLGAQGVAGHELRGAPGDATGLQHRLLVTRKVEAVTAACLVIERDKFLSVGGFDEEAFPVAYNDVDLCLRLSDAGLRTLWTPHARLVHVESASRGRGGAGGREEALQAAAGRMHQRWGERLGAGADYPATLSRRDETFSLA